jgi:hypothetical protein
MIEKIDTIRCLTVRSSVLEIMLVEHSVDDDVPAARSTVDVVLQ